jgi:hypothetical protein
MPFCIVQGGNQMNITLDQGRSSLLEQLQFGIQERTSIGKSSLLASQGQTSLKDIFERSAVPTSKEALPGKFQNNNDTRSIQAGGLNISFQFDLFYELTSKVEARMGRQGAERFVELSGKVSETFMGSFNLSIDAVGSFMNGTDKSIDISPEVTGEFFDAVEGLADLSPEALENFLKESDEFFAELENVYGKADGAFGQIKSLMQEQAKAFFADVGSARNNAAKNLENAASPNTEPELPEAETSDISSALATLAAESGKKPSLIELFFKPETKVSQNDYQDFLADFFEYAEKFKQQMFEKLFASRNPYEKAAKIGSTQSETPKPAIDAAA